MQRRNNPRARIDGIPNALGEAFLEDEDDDEDDYHGAWPVPPSFTAPPASRLERSGSGPG